MSNQQITSQLTRVTVPSISDGKFADGIRNAFETINNNFKTIASLPFIQGVQGDSYTLISKDIWVEVNDMVSPVYYALTKEGAVLLNSIFESVLDDTKKFNEGDSFDECKTNILGELSLNGVSPIDSFFTEKIEDGKTVKELVNNKLYFYSVINNLDEEQETYLGQYFYFIDYRITELGNAYQSEKLSKFTDFTGFYQYQPANDKDDERYDAISIVPNLYYDKDKDDICWKYNGQETGISAIGPKGLDGKDADFKIVYVQYVNDTDNSGDILGYFDSVTKSIKYTSTLENCFCLVQIVDAEINEDNIIKINSYHDSAFGEVHDGKAYWENSLKIGKLFNNQNINKYFCSMGNDSDEPTDIENHPYYLAIPVSLNRDNATDNSYKEGHVFSSSEDGKLVLQKAKNAFTEAGGQKPLNELDISGLQGEFNIKNYDVSIKQNLNVSGTLGVKGIATFDSNLSVHDTATIQKLKVSNGATVSGTLGVTGNATIDGTLGVTGKVTFGSDLSVGGTLGVYNKATFGNDLSLTSGTLTVPNTAKIRTLEVSGNTKIDGTLGVSGTATFDNSVIVTGGSFDVDLNDGNISLQSGNYGIDFDENGTINIDGNEVIITNDVNIGGSAVVTGKIIGQSGIKVSRGGEIIGVNDETPGGIGLIVEGGKGVTGTKNSGGTGLIVRGGTCNTGSTGLGLKVERGGAEIYSGTGASNDDNVLKIKDNSVSISGKKGLLSAHKIVSDTANFYYRSNAGTSNSGTDKGITYTLTDMITGDEGNIHCGGISDITSSNSFRTLYNRSALQAYNQSYDSVSGSQNYIGTQFFINPCGGTVYINQRVPEADIEGSTSTTTGALIVNGGAGIKENLYIGERLVVNEGGTSNSVAPSYIHGYNAYGGTTQGGTGLIVKGGSGKKTSVAHTGSGGIGLTVWGGTAGDFQGSANYAGYGGTGLVVYGGDDGISADGTNTGHIGDAIRTYGNLIIGDKSGDYETKISSDSTGLIIDKHTTISSGATINGSATINGNATINGIATFENGATIKLGATFENGATIKTGATIQGPLGVTGNATINGNLTVNKLLKARIMKSMESTAYLTIGDGTQIYDEYIYSKITTGDSHLYITFNPPSGWKGVVKLVILILVTGASYGDKTIYFKTYGDSNYKQLKYDNTGENYYDNGGHTMVELYYNGTCWGVIHSPVGSHAHKAVWV